MLTALLISFQYKKFGSKETMATRLLEVANHVDKVRLIIRYQRNVFENVQMSCIYIIDLMS